MKWTAHIEKGCCCIITRWPCATVATIAKATHSYVESKTTKRNIYCATLSEWMHLNIEVFVSLVHSMVVAVAQRVREWKMQSNFFFVSALAHFVCGQWKKKYSQSEHEKISGILFGRERKNWNWNRKKWKMVWARKKLYTLCIVQCYHLTPNIFFSLFFVGAVVLIKRCVLSSFVMTTLDGERAMAKNIANMHIPYTTNTTSESHKNRPRIELCIYNFQSTSFFWFGRNGEKICMCAPCRPCIQ